MKRDPKLLEKRIKKVGMFFEIKKSKGIPSKVAVIEIAEALSLSKHTVNRHLTKYNKFFSIGV